jgi:hypothetical protein
MTNRQRLSKKEATNNETFHLKIELPSTDAMAPLLKLATMHPNDQDAFVLKQQEPTLTPHNNQLNQKQ